MDDRDLLVREHANLIEAWVIAAAAPEGGLVRRTGGVACLLSGLPAAQFNQIIVEDDAASPDAVVAAVVEARDRPAPWMLDLRVGTDDRFVPVAAALGLVPMTPEPWMPGMALWPVPTEPPQRIPGHEIRRVTDDAGVADHVATASDAFGIPDELMRAIITPEIARLPAVAVYVGYTDGVRVTAGMSVRSGSTIGVYNIATLASARRRGYGEAMTVRLAVDGVAAGCDLAVLQASPMGLRLYERLGYRTVVRYMAYVEPALAAG
jgi:ribosomal protein S18 acetylase RimI-like enzyme